jgi:hypothetical protein
MLYNFLALLLDFYRLNIHRKPAQAVHFDEPTGVGLSQFGLLRSFASLGCVCVCGGGTSAVTYRSPTLLIPITTRSFLRQNSTSVCASVNGSSLT